MDIGFTGAFLGGILTLLSPCTVMLLPAFFAYAFGSPALLLRRTGLFFLGLIATLVPLGMLAGSLGALVNQHRFTLITAASVLMIIFGLIQLIGVGIPGLSRLTAMASTPGESRTTGVTVFLLGTVYGLAGVCAGPLLGTVLTLAALGGNALYGGLVLLVFAAGMTLPLLLLALVWGKLPWVKRLVRPRELVIGRWRNSWTNIIGGLLIIGIGILLIVTEGTTGIAGLLTASQQFTIETWVMNQAGEISNWLFVVLAALLLLAGWLVRRLVTRRRDSAAAVADRAPVPPREHRPQSRH